MKVKFNAIDSVTGIPVPGHRIFSVSYEPKWQQLRSTLSFRTQDDALRAKAALDRYVLTSGSPYERQCNVWRALNFTNAGPIGQHSPKSIPMIPRDTEGLIVDCREALRILLEEVKKPEYWDWKTTHEALAEMVKHATLRVWLVRHHNTLLSARGNAFRRQAKPELYYYLNLIKGALNEF
jgi:hypothetical protein